MITCTADIELFSGLYHGNKWFQDYFPPQLLQTAALEKNLSMAFKELYPIVIACVLWGREWKKKRLCMLNIFEELKILKLMHVSVPDAEIPTTGPSSRSSGHFMSNASRFNDELNSQLGNMWEHAISAGTAKTYGTALKTYKRFCSYIWRTIAAT